MTSRKLAALVGLQAPGLSPQSICRLKAKWPEEFTIWRKRDLSQKRYVYWWGGRGSWVYKTANVLDKLRKSVQKKAQDDLHQAGMAETREEVIKAFNLFITKYPAKYSKATDCLAKDREGPGNGGED